MKVFKFGGASVKDANAVKKCSNHPQSFSERKHHCSYFRNGKNHQCA